jgi:alpha-ketoglutaric semialdehyde dehydrogenase
MAHPNIQNLIGGQWLPARSGKTILNLNPADHADIVGEFPASGCGGRGLAVAAAKKAFATWRLFPPPSVPRFCIAPAMLSGAQRSSTPAT